MNIDDKEQDQIDRARYKARKDLEKILSSDLMEHLSALDIVYKHEKIFHHRRYKNR